MISLVRQGFTPSLNLVKILMRLDYYISILFEGYGINIIR